MTTQTSTARTCSVCGQKKPLFAFLELSTKGHTYGDICATCRSTGLGRKKSPELESVERSGGQTGVAIDSKKRLKEAAIKEDQFKKTLESDYEEKIKKENTQEDQLEKTQDREAGEKRHREEYLEQKQTISPKDQVAQTGETQVTQRFYHKAQISTAASNKAAGEKIEQRVDNISAADVAKAASATGRSVRSLFGQQMGTLMKSYLDKNNLGSALEKFQQKTEAKPGLLSKSLVNEQLNKQAQQQEKDNLATEFVKKNFMKK